MEGGFFSKPKGDDSHGDAGSMHSSTVATAGRPQERCVNRGANIDRRRQVFPRKVCRKKEAPPRQESSVLSVLSVIRRDTDNAEPHADGGAADRGDPAAMAAEEPNAGG